MNTEPPAAGPPFTLRLSSPHPVKRHHIGDRSLSLCNMFLDEMAKQARNLITDICTEQCTLSDQVHALAHTDRQTEYSFLPAFPSH